MTLNILNSLDILDINHLRVYYTLVTYGCYTNTVDSEIVARILVSRIALKDTLVM